MSDWKFSWFVKKADSDEEVGGSPAGSHEKPRSARMPLEEKLERPRASQSQSGVYITKTDIAQESIWQNPVGDQGIGPNARVVPSYRFAVRREV